MSEIKCPKCGANEGIAGEAWQWFQCDSAITKIGTDFDQSDKCKLTCAEKRIKELDEENARLRKFLSSYVKSARPNKLDHPKKFASWAEAKELLSNHGVRQPKDL